MVLSTAIESKHKKIWSNFSNSLTGDSNVIASQASLCFVIRFQRSELFCVLSSFETNKTFAKPANKRCVYFYSRDKVKSYGQMQVRQQPAPIFKSDIAEKSSVCVEDLLESCAKNDHGEIRRLVSPRHVSSIIQSVFTKTVPAREDKDAAVELGHNLFTVMNGIFAIAT